MKPVMLFSAAILIFYSTSRTGKNENKNKGFKSESKG